MNDEAMMQEYRKRIAEAAEECKDLSLLDLIWKLLLKENAA